METFDQTVWITLVGTGLTFAALGLLVAAMAALVRLTRGRGESVSLPEESRQAAPEEELEELERAAAVAVAMALAQAARRAHPTYAWHAAEPSGDVSPWQAYARGQQLERYKTHQTLRW
jgi:Na+-transporting methylmalonyl-CoA/oxaloacetate decarboxylase gamma subunit